LKQTQANRTPQQPDALLGQMDSLSDATRLRLLRLLELHELGVVELCEVLQMPQSTVSRHLKVLADQKWTTSRRQGTTNLYRMILDELDPAARKLWLLAREQTQDWPALSQDQLRLTRRLNQKQSEAESFFAGAAGQWDKLRTELYGQYFPSAAVAGLLPRHWVVADLGCGTGAMTVELAANVKQVIGVDQSAAMLKAARRRTADLPGVDLRKGDLSQLPMTDDTCDGVMLSLVLTYVPDPLAVLREAARVLKPGGSAVVVDLLHHGREDFRRQMGQHWPGFEPIELSRWMTEAGLVDPVIRSLSPHPEAKGPALLLASAEGRRKT
jgi:ArsR family transcriptional regulator